MPPGAGPNGLITSNPVAIFAGANPIKLCTVVIYGFLE